MKTFTLADPAFLAAASGGESEVLPPSSGSLLVWMDANDIIQADGVSVPTMPNKGTLGGTWSRSGPLAPVAATIGGRRALSFPLTWPSVSPNYGYDASSFTFPATTAAQGITMVVIASQQSFAPDGTGGPTAYLANAGARLGDSSIGLAIYAVSMFNPFPLRYYWRNTQPSQTGSSRDSFYNASSQLVGEFAAYGTQLSSTLPNNQSFFQLRKDAADFSAFADGVATGIVGTLAGQVTIGGTGSAASYVWSGWIREVLIWNTLVSQADIRAWLDEKYGPTW